MRDRLAADLHDIACGASARAEWDLCVRDHRHEADRLIALGWTNDKSTANDGQVSHALDEDTGVIAKLRWTADTDMVIREDADAHD